MVCGCRLDNPSHGRSSMGSDPKHDPYNDGDADSLAEYGDGDTGKLNIEKDKFLLKQ